MMASTGSTDSRRNMNVRASADLRSTHCRSSITMASAPVASCSPATSSSRNPPTLAVEHARKDVVQLHPNERVELFFRFRDWLGRYPLHCHNVIHEDHAMMLRWEIDPNGGDNTLVP